MHCCCCCIRCGPVKGLKGTLKLELKLFVKPPQKWCDDLEKNSHFAWLLGWLTGWDDDLKILSHFRFRLLVFFNELLTDLHSFSSLTLRCWCVCAQGNSWAWTDAVALFIVMLWSVGFYSVSWPGRHSTFTLPTAQLSSVQFSSANYVLRMCFNDVHVITVIFMNSCGNIQLNSKNKITSQLVSLPAIQPSSYSQTLSERIAEIFKFLMCFVEAC